VAPEGRGGLHGGRIDAVLDLAAKNRETLLFNRYQAARATCALPQGTAVWYVISDKQTDTPEAGLLAQKMIDNGVDVYASKSGFSQRLSYRRVRG